MVYSQSGITKLIQQPFFFSSKLSSNVNLLIPKTALLISPDLIVIQPWISVHHSTYLTSQTAGMHSNLKHMDFGGKVEPERGCNLFYFPLQMFEWTKLVSFIYTRK